MERLISCEFNMDTACVELKFVDGSMISIDTIAVENEVADNMYQRSELDWLIYNKPLEYAQLVLYGNLERYVKGTPEHRLIENKCDRAHRSTMIGGLCIIPVRNQEFQDDSLFQMLSRIFWTAYGLAYLI